MIIALSVQTLILVVLGVLVVVLSALLARRSRTSSDPLPLPSALPVDLNAISEFLRTCSDDGTIQVVASRVSELLKSACQCDYIIFLRKHRGVLELNYYHGIRRFNRTDFRIRFSDQLFAAVKENFLPRSSKQLDNFLPKLMQERLQEFNLNLYFPIYWRDNLYGIYFVHSTADLTSPSYAGAIGMLAQSLSVAYHIKWHESKLEKLGEKTATKMSEGRPARAAGMPVLTLVRHRNMESLLPQMVDTLHTELGVDRVAFLYEPTPSAEDLHVVRSGVSKHLNPPDKASFSSLVSGSEVGKLQKLSNPEDATDPEWVSEWRKAGLEYVMPFPLSEDRQGLLALSGERSPEEMLQRINQLMPVTRDLVINAELFEQMEALSYTDNLTGLANQRYFMKRLHEEIDRAHRYGRSLALIILDLDELKAINDRYGHQAGDSFLVHIGKVLKGSIRAIDIIARYGGDEFCIIMPEADSTTCMRFMARLRERLAATRCPIPGTDISVHGTVSLGGAVYPDHAGDADKLIYCADMALLRAKERGRNTHLLFTEIVQTSN